MSALTECFTTCWRAFWKNDGSSPDCWLALFAMLSWLPTRPKNSVD